MSKILNELKEPPLNPEQEELAKIYFASPSTKPDHPLQDYRGSNYKKGNRFLLWTFLFLTLGITTALFLSNKISIDIEVSPFLKTAPIHGTPDRGRVIYLNNNGEPNLEIIKSIMFYDNTDAKISSWGKELIVLSNDVAFKKAALGIDFNKPINLLEEIFSFNAKGKRGQEDFRISLRDDRGNHCYSKINRLQNLWEQYILDLEDTKGFMDPTNITHIEVEVNPNEKEGLNLVTIYLKGLCLKKGKGE